MRLMLDRIVTIRQKPIVSFFFRYSCCFSVVVWISSLGYAVSFTSNPSPCFNVALSVRAVLDILTLIESAPVLPSPVSRPIDRSYIDSLLNDADSFRVATLDECEQLAELLGVDRTEPRGHHHFTVYERLVLFLDCLSSRDPWRQMALRQKRSDRSIRRDFMYWVNAIVTQLDQHAGMTMLCDVI